MPDKIEELKDIPGFSQGVRINSAMRMMKLGRPICPNSKVEYQRDTTGRYVPQEKGPDTANCQLAGGKWWIECGRIGHRPYIRIRKWQTTEPVIEVDDEGRSVIRGEQVFYHQTEEPNVAQVAVALRINNGRGAVEAIEQKGFKRLPDLGFNEVCQFRNCQKPTLPEGTSRKFGAYCGVEHLSLIAADAEGVVLTQVNSGISGEKTRKSQQRRDRQLREILVGA
jgi:hypothetical protein